MTPNSYLTLSREDLYELVWSKPMMELAKDFGLSDVALAKRCRKLGVPVPGRGYWARVAAGQIPHQPKLSKREPEPGAGSALRFAPPVEDSPPAETPDLAAEEAAIRAQIDAVSVTTLPNLGSASPPVQRVASRERVIPAKDIAWARRGDRQGPIPKVEVSDTQTARALQIADALLRAAAALGWPFEAIKPKEPDYRDRFRPLPESMPGGNLIIAGEPFCFRIDEAQKRTDHVLTADEIHRQKKESWFHPPPWDFHWSGDLRLHAYDPEYRNSLRTWKDGKRRRLEDQTHKILHGLYDLALKAKAQRRQHEQWEQKRRERERLERARAERRDAELKLIHDLERQAGAWFRAKFLHRYVRAAQRALGNEQMTAQRGGETVDFLVWAQGYVDQLNPLHPAAHNDDLLSERSIWHGDQDIQKGMARLVGFEGQKACKLFRLVEDGDVDQDDDSDDW